jgi:hypothetical protein
MSNAARIIDEIDQFLDRFGLKKNKLTSRDLIDYIEEKWKQADSKKYKLRAAYTIAGRMVTEYIELKDYANMARWLDEEDAASPFDNPEYINNRYRGECCLECGNEEKALHYLRLCHAENPEHIFTEAPPFVAEFFNQHLQHPVAMRERDEGDDEPLQSTSVKLKSWQSFFGEETEDLPCDVLDADGELLTSLKASHRKGLKYLQDNQQIILQSVLTALLKEYPALQRRYGYKGKEKRDFMPGVKEIKGFAPLLSPTCIYVLSRYKNRFPYMGYSFHCSWDAEHGLGVMMYQDQVVAIGGADVAFAPPASEAGN